jgi:ABC-2 type transport system permease protein
VSGLVRAEARKAAATPVNWLLLAVSTLLGALSTVLLVALADEEGAALLTDSKLQEAMHGASVGVILVAVAGAMGMAGDWRFGQADTAFLTSPRRWRVVRAKATVYAAVGAVFGAVVSTGALVGAGVAYGAEGLTFPLDRSAVWLTLLGVSSSAVLLAVLGVALGAIVRSPIVAVVGALAWFFLVEPVVFSASTAVARWLPGLAATGLGRAPEDALLSPGPAALVLAGVTAAALAGGMRLVERDDVAA